jgi:hypothetical protein
VRRGRRSRLAWLAPRQAFIGAKAQNGLGAIAAIMETSMLGPHL